MSKTGKIRKSERRKLHSLPSKEAKEVREKQQANLELSRGRGRQKERQRGLWGKNEYSDDDFVSRLFVKWPFPQLLEYSKLLILILHRRSMCVDGSSSPPTSSTSLNALIHYRYPSEYYDTLFATYTRLWRGERVLSFSAYYTEIYKEALEHSGHLKKSVGVNMSQLTRYHCAMLKACFMVALTYEPRIRRFVFTRHDIHYDYMKTHPPSVAKTSEFIAEMQPFVNRFIESSLGGEALAKYATDSWLSHYMFRLD